MTGEGYRHHRAAEFKKFLALMDQPVPETHEMHRILDNYGTHKTVLIYNGLRRPRYPSPFTPTRAPRLNQIERWFAEVTPSRIRCGTFRSTQALEAAIREHLQVYYEAPQYFIWTKSANDVLKPLKPYCKWSSSGRHQQLNRQLQMPSSPPLRFVMQPAAGEPHRNDAANRSFERRDRPYRRRTPTAVFRIGQQPGRRPNINWVWYHQAVQGLALVDYDNLCPGNRSELEAEASTTALLESLARATQRAFPGLGELDVRLYGGWLDELGVPSPSARWLLTLLPALRGRRQGLIVRPTLAMTMFQFPNLALRGTVRLHVKRRRQKMVDGMLGCDAVFAVGVAESKVGIVSDDDDLLPAALSAYATNPSGAAWIRRRAAGAGVNDRVLRVRGVRIHSLDQA